MNVGCVPCHLLIGGVEKKEQALSRPFSLSPPTEEARRAPQPPAAGSPVRGCCSMDVPPPSTLFAECGARTRAYLPPRLRTRFPTCYFATPLPQGSLEERYKATKGASGACPTAANLSILRFPKRVCRRRAPSRSAMKPPRAPPARATTTGPSRQAAFACSACRHAVLACRLPATLACCAVGLWEWW